MLGEYVLSIDADDITVVGDGRRIASCSLAQNCLTRVESTRWLLSV